MFQRIRQGLRDAGTIKALCQGAEQYALQEGQQQPGAEHFMLAALDLPDGSARRTFERLGVDPAQVRGAIAKQYEQALRHIGIDPSALAAAGEGSQPARSKAGLYDASPSGQALIQALAEPGNCDRQGAPLLGAHVLAVIATMEQGVAARTLRALGMELDALANAAAQVIAQSGAGVQAQR